MDSTTTIQEPAPREEGFLHFVAREVRAVLRWAIGLSLVAIVICMVSPGFYFVAVAPALAMLVSFVLLVLANAVERRSDPVAHEILERAETAAESDVTEDHADDDQLLPAEQKIVKRECKTVIGIVGAVLLTALLIASVVFELQVLAIGAFVVFAYILLVAAPLWLGWIEDDIEKQTQTNHKEENA